VQPKIVGGSQECLTCSFSKQRSRTAASFQHPRRTVGLSWDDAANALTAGVALADSPDEVVKYDGKEIRIKIGGCRCDGRTRPCGV